ncbi:hypothetical protein Thal_0292 [Thermocrinis albus DSM 14484]|uniref:Uncharacterized protein n=1 Tax=Thermocrinis albus (strain DSM 14484 / JCM 11386 / HI 11/12) TaxID=638303 RepID=D3SP40_THEAH|nr:hypothetical protein [Thermocrinis albus]ADC88927.1 hypothetical protein Thal_0292 [Thermocrinis albus DSM 14484]
MIKEYHRRIKKFHRAWIGFVSIVFLGSLPTYPFFRLPLHPNTKWGLTFLVVVLFFITFVAAVWIKGRVFPVEHQQDPLWNYTATRRYFWLFSLVSLPFFFSFLFYLIFPSLTLLTVGYILTIFGLIFLRPKEEDVL